MWCSSPFLLYRIRVSKGLNFPDGLFSRIFDHNIYQRCAASPQDIVAQIFKKISPSWKWTFDTLIFIGNFSFHIKQKTLREDTLPIDNSNFPHFKFATTTFCLLCQWLYCILQPLKSGFCHPRTIVIALPHFVFIVISKFCCLWCMIYMPYGELEVPEARYSSFLKGTLRSSLLMSRISETLSNVT